MRQRRARCNQEQGMEWDRKQYPRNDWNDKNLARNQTAAPSKTRWQISRTSPENPRTSRPFPRDKDWNTSQATPRAWKACNNSGMPFGANDHPQNDVPWKQDIGEWSTRALTAIKSLRNWVPAQPEPVQSVELWTISHPAENNEYSRARSKSSRQLVQSKVTLQLAEA